MHLKDLPSCLRRLWKTTVLAGALTPMAKVSVEKSTLMSPRQNSISTTSFMIGSSPMCNSVSLLLAFDELLIASDGFLLARNKILA